MKCKSVMILLAAALIVVVSSVTTDLVNAGTNGQQLLISVSCQYAPPLAEVKVSGYNQRGQYTTWYARPNSKNVVTYGYWWVGNIRIAYRYAGINPYTELPFGWYVTFADVPKTFNRDVYPVAVDWDDDCRPAWKP
jgi:hypothetical protein